MPPLNVLILGGAGEAAALAGRLAGDGRFRAVVSMAGRTRAPRALGLPQRTGGFGGVEGLVRYLEDERVQALVAALHPFAAQMRRHAVEAARRTGSPLALVDRPAWAPAPGDRWRQVANMEAAAEALGPEPRRVLLTIGRQQLEPFVARPHHAYLVRSIEPPERLPEGAELLLARGPFSEAEEVALMQARDIQVLVTKNAGGAAVEAKLMAARRLGLPVVMVERPLAPELSGVRVERLGDAEAAFAWLERLHQAGTGVERGV